MPEATLPYPPVDGRPFRVTLGLRTLDLADWLERDSHAESELARKRELLARHHDEVVAVLPEGLPGSQETLDLVVAHETTHGRAATARPALHPIDAAGRLVQEDLCVLAAEAGQWRLVAASVCFPSRWSLADKIGRTLAEIHEPVPGYGPIAHPVEKLFDRLLVDRPMWRLNWSLLDDPELFQPVHETRTQPAPVDPRDYTLRVERQTLRRLPRTGDILFTIRTHRTRLGELAGSRPDFLADLRATLATVPPDSQAYKGWTDAMPRLLAYLDRAAGSDNSGTLAAGPSGGLP